MMLGHRFLPAVFTACAAPLALMTATFASQRAIAQPLLTNLGVRPGSSFSEVRAISADGRTVIGRDGFPGLTSGFRWTASGGLEELGLLGGNIPGTGVATSEDGMISIGSARIGVLDRAVRWVHNVGAAPLDPSVAESTAAWATSANGLAATGAIQTLAGRRPFRWTQSGGTQTLDTPLGTLSAIANGMNADGTALCGWFHVLGQGPEAFRWSTENGMQPLGFLSLGSRSESTAMSQDGLAITGNANTVVTGLGSFDRAFIWTSSDGMHDLGVPVGGVASFALAINGTGTAVSGYFTTPSADEYRAFLWTAEDGMMDLNAYLPTIGIDLSGWTLTHATGLSADGLSIAGNGFYNGEPRAWIVTGVPAPSAVAPLVIAAICITRRRR